MSNDKTEAGSAGWLSAKDAQKHLGISNTTFFKAVRDGQIKGYTLAGTGDPRYSISELNETMVLKVAS